MSTKCKNKAHEFCITNEHFSHLCVREDCRARMRICFAELSVSYTYKTHSTWVLQNSHQSMYFKIGVRGGLNCLAQSPIWKHAKLSQILRGTEKNTRGLGKNQHWNQIPEIQGTFQFMFFNLVFAYSWAPFLTQHWLVQWSCWCKTKVGPICTSNPRWWLPFIPQQN